MHAVVVLRAWASLSALSQVSISYASKKGDRDQLQYVDLLDTGIKIKLSRTAPNA
jgi:hypothetical protein